ncbi:hypothetical protein EV359DRAFT_84109 [Lentinula novae-zelandiae]|nr:hypothetical protein EV359DRAFT_84109 [Lentinula novae-zelandiae]
MVDAEGHWEHSGIGHPEDIDRIWQAATLGGASEFIEHPEDGYDTYLDRPVRDHYSGLRDGTIDLFGRAVNFEKIRSMGGMKSNESTALSGGQMQRIALSRTFMRSLVFEPSVGLLLFDEPSASLDPTAEHGTILPFRDCNSPSKPLQTPLCLCKTISNLCIDLFERLRRLHGQKTMIISSHRFGNLTRNADMILYMQDAVVVEEGSHNSLLKAGGEYARVWSLQA